jgi:Glyoxalase/Bleomycin resistance protein/Dioxygenase superfamily
VPIDAFAQHPWYDGRGRPRGAKFKNRLKRERMTNTKLTHYAIRTTDLEASRRFYTEVMGLLRFLRNLVRNACPALLPFVFARRTSKNGPQSVIAIMQSAAKELSNMTTSSEVAQRFGIR